MIRKIAALVGFGRWGKNIGRNLSELGVLHTICDALPITPFPNIHTTCDFQSILNHPHITQVFIATPANTHYALAKQALMAGKDVFVEKPLCLDLQEGEDLVKTADQFGRVLMVGHLLNYHPCTRKIKELLYNDALGEIRVISARRVFPGAVREENVLWDLLPHDISVILSLCHGSFPESIVSRGSAINPYETMDTITVSLKFPNHILADMTASWVYPFKEQKLVVIGTRGSLVFDDAKDWGEKLSFHLLKGSLFPKIEYEKVDCPIEKEEPLKMECLHFLECCQNRRQPLTNGLEALNCLRLLHEIQEQNALLPLKNG
jgi:UDP-2-acetamido-3-amino-2,3-dideoxy-glucuronate N-acetyltransferase